MKVVVGLSGGVDSAVAALLLVEAGHEVQGLFMSNWEEDDRYCTVAEDYQDARAVCRELRIPLHRVDFASEYRQRVFDYFLAEHRAGRTPNPDVLCNREIKFGVCLAHARRLGAERFATGHYARHIEGSAGPELHKGADPDKDQSYFLHALELEQLAAAMFPLGEWHKTDVRAKARTGGLPVHDKPDSTGICFIGERPFREFLATYLSDSPGDIETPEGALLGRHRGLAFYTVGQRGGLEIGGQAGYAEQPWYVARKDAVRGALIVVQGHDHPLLMTRTLRTGPAHWLGPAPDAPIEAHAKIRYRQSDQACRITPMDAGRLEVEFEQPQRAATPGQFVVFYAGSRCLGGAVIESV